MYSTQLMRFSADEDEKEQYLSAFVVSNDGVDENTFR